MWLKKYKNLINPIRYSDLFGKLMSLKIWSTFKHQEEVPFKLTKRSRKLLWTWLKKRSLQV